jgi:hypothetical protein
MSQNLTKRECANAASGEKHSVSVCARLSAWEECADAQICVTVGLSSAQTTSAIAPGTRCAA